MFLEFALAVRGVESRASESALRQNLYRTDQSEIGTIGWQESLSSGTTKPTSVINVEILNPDAFSLL